MGLLKELRDKQAAGTITDEEKELLAGLEKDLQEGGGEGGDAPAPAPEVNPEDEKEMDAIATKLADAITSKIEKGMSSSQPTPAQPAQESKLLIDTRQGKKTVQELEDTKVELADRKAAGKKHTEVSEKTVQVLQAMFTGDSQKLQTLVEGTGSRGGYLVPEDFMNIVVEDKRDMTVMRQLATVLQVSTDTIHIPNLASRPKAFWRSEGAVKSTTTVDFGETVLTPYSLAAIVGISNELVADAALGGNIVSLVAGYMSRALAEEEDKQFWTGNGSGKPTGIDNYTFDTVNAGAGASDSAKADAIIRALYRLPQGYRQGAVFVANRNTWAKVATLKDSQNNYLLSDLGSAASPTLRGLRTMEQNDIGDGKMFVGDFSYYYIADREGIQVDTSQEATVASQNAFERNLTFVRVEERVDGELTLTQPIVEVQGIGGF